jgi:hypothetical protein
MLNFGLVPTDAGPRSMDLLILNSGSRPVTLTSLVATPVTDALTVDFTSVKVKSNLLFCSICQPFPWQIQLFANSYLPHKRVKMQSEINTKVLAVGSANKLEAKF